MSQCDCGGLLVPLNEAMNHGRVLKCEACGFAYDAAKIAKKDSPMKDEQAIRQMLLIFEGFGDKPDAVTALKWVLGEWPTPQPVTCPECEAHKRAVSQFEIHLRSLQQANAILTASNQKRQRKIEELQIAAIREKEGK